MIGAELAAIRRHIGDKTQEQMAELLGVSLIGLKRYETDARPIPDYIARSAKAMELCYKHNLLSVLEGLFKKSLS